MDRYREITTLPWRNPISGGPDPERPPVSWVVGVFLFALFLIALVIGGLCLE